LNDISAVNYVLHTTHSLLTRVGQAAVYAYDNM